MAFTATITESFKLGAETLSESNAFADGATQSIDEPIAASQTDWTIAFTLDVTACVAFYMVCDAEIVVETNNGGAPDDTITLVADVPYIWYTTNYNSFLLTTDVTSLFVTTTASPATVRNLKIRAVYNPHP